MRTITNQTELKSLMTDKKFSHELVKLELAGIKDEELVSWQMKLNSYINECGCSMGAKFMQGSVALYLVIILVWPDIIVMSILNKLLVGFGVLILGAIAGKIIGLSMARIMFKKSCRQLLALTTC